MGKGRLILFILLIFIFSAGQIAASDQLNATISVNNSTALVTNGSLDNASIHKSANSVIYVNNSTGPVADYTSIQDAINNSKDGDSIIVYGGVYEEQVVVDRELKILAGPGETVPAVQCDFRENYTYDELANSIFLVRSNNVTISGFSIIGDGYHFTTGIYLLGAENCSVVNNNLMSCGYGIYLDDSNNNSLEKNSIIPTSEDFSILGTGIHFRQSSGNYVTDNKISRCREGIEITKDSNRNKVLNCEISSSIVLEYSFNNIIENNTLTALRLSNSHENYIFNNSNCELTLFDSDSNELIGNNFSSCSTSVYLCRSDKNILRDNSVNFHLTLFDSDSNELIGNNFSFCSMSVYLCRSDKNILRDNSVNCQLTLFDSDSNELIGNNISFRSTYGVYLSRSDKNILRDNSVNHNNVFPDQYIHGDYFYEHDPLELSGIYLFKSHHNILENNSASYNLFNGIRLDDSDYNLFANNTIESNNEAGLLLHNCSQNEVYHNEIKGNKYGIKTESTLSFKEWKLLENIIEENIFENNGRKFDKSYFELPRFQINAMVILITVYLFFGILIILVLILIGILIYDKVKKRKSE